MTIVRPKTISMIGSPTKFCRWDISNRASTSTRSSTLLDHRKCLTHSHSMDRSRMLVTDSAQTSILELASGTGHFPRRTSFTISNSSTIIHGVSTRTISGPPWLPKSSSVSTHSWSNTRNMWQDFQISCHLLPVWWASCLRFLPPLSEVSSFGSRWSSVASTSTPKRMILWERLRYTPADSASTLEICRLFPASLLLATRRIIRSSLKRSNLCRS